jgi:hypothetical protein
MWSPGRVLLTTNHVVGETWTFLRRRDGHASARAFLGAVGSADWLTVVQVDEGIEREARAWLRRHDERVYSFVDATSFVVMRRERLRGTGVRRQLQCGGLRRGASLVGPRPRARRRRRAPWRTPGDRTGSRHHAG